MKKEEFKQLIRECYKEVIQEAEETSVSIADKIAKVESAQTHNLKLKLVFGWIRQGTINFDQFHSLLHKIYKPVPGEPKEPLVQPASQPTPMPAPQPVAKPAPVKPVNPEKKSVKEVSTTGGVAGYNTPKAFSKNGKANTDLATKSLPGYKVV